MVLKFCMFFRCFLLPQILLQALHSKQSAANVLCHRGNAASGASKMFGAVEPEGNTIGTLEIIRWDSHKMYDT